MRLLIVDGMTANVHARHSVWIDFVKISQGMDFAYYFMPDKGDRDYSKFFGHIFPPYKIFHEISPDLASVTAALLCRLTIEVIRLPNIKSVMLLTDSEIFRPLIEYYIRSGAHVTLASNNGKLASLTSSIIFINDLPKVEK